MPLVRARERLAGEMAVGFPIAPTAFVVSSQLDELLIV